MIHLQKFKKWKNIKHRNISNGGTVFYRTSTFLLLKLTAQACAGYDPPVCYQRPRLLALLFQLFPALLSYSLLRRASRPAGVFRNAASSERNH